MMTLYSDELGPGGPINDIWNMKDLRVEKDQYKAANESIFLGINVEKWPQKCRFILTP